MTCGGLNDAEKALINGKIHNILGVIDLPEIPTLNVIRGQFLFYARP